MDAIQIEELERRVKENSTDIGTQYKLGMAYYKEEDWMKAYKSFKYTEVLILDNIGDFLKEKGYIEAAQGYYKRARNIENRPFKLTPGGSHWARNFFLPLGIIASICILLVFLTCLSPIAIISLIILLIEFLVLSMMIPIVLVKHFTSKRRNPEPFLQKIQFLERQIEMIVQNDAIPETEKFLRIGKLKQTRARMAANLARIKYSESVEYRK